MFVCKIYLVDLSECVLNNCLLSAWMSGNQVVKYTCVCVCVCVCVCAELGDSHWCSPVGLGAREHVLSAKTQQNKPVTFHRIAWSYSAALFPDCVSCIYIPGLISGDCDQLGKLTHINTHIHRATAVVNWSFEHCKHKSTTKIEVCFTLKFLPLYTLTFALLLIDC